MTTSLIVSAPPGPTSFTASWARASIDGARAAGHEVLSSDLHAMGFDPVEAGARYGISGGFDPLKAQEAAAREGHLPDDVEGEIAKIRAADVVIFHFPIWWFAPPAIVKGWCDRVLVHGALHDVDHRFDAGPCRGKTALICASTGASATEVGPGGKEGRIDLQLWPLAYTLRYCGFDIAAPVLAHDVHGYWQGAEKAALEDKLAAILAAQAGIIADLEARPRWPFHADTDFDESGRLRDGIAPLWPFHG